MSSCSACSPVTAYAPPPRERSAPPPPPPRAEEQSVEKPKAAKAPGTGSVVDVQA